jgi:cytochrome c biogenesis factor
MPANPDAIAWYLRRSEDLLIDLREQVQLLRVRGGQIAGFSGAVLALAGANVASVLGDLHGAARACAGVAFLTGVLLLVAALVTALRGTLVPELFSEISVKEVANFNSERFTNEPDLWRIHMRTIRGLLRLIELTTIQGDRAARAARRAEYLFLAGLLAVGTALAILISVVTL